MGAKISDDDRDFCRLYGAQCRDFYGNVPWELGAPRLQRGWFRVRGSSAVDWPDAEPHVREGWNGIAERGADARESES